MNAVVLLFWVAIGYATAVPSAAATQPESRPAPAPGAEVEEFVYKTTEQAKLKMHVHFPPGWTSADRRPAIVFFFGGGWKSGSAGQFAPQARYFARRGMVAARADYRVESRHGVAPDRCVEDAKSAVRWLRRNADRLGIDPDRIVASGGSAGGHMAACTATTEGLEAAGEDTSVSSRPNALILFNPPLDVVHPRIIGRLGGDEVLARTISPYHNLKEGGPPTLILFGTADPLIAQVPPYIERARSLGHRVELYTAEGARHGFFNRSPWLERTLRRTDEFLVELGYLKGAPTIEIPTSGKAGATRPAG